MIGGKIVLTENINYKLYHGNTVVILSPLLQKRHDINVIISTKLIKFKHISA